MIKTVLFDMNETLLNLNQLKKSFDKHFEDDSVLSYWFTKLLHTSTVMGIVGEYKNFGELSGVVLENLFHQFDKELTEETRIEILGAFRNLPPHDDVSESLKILRENNIRVIALSNSSLAMIKEQLTNGGIIQLFDTYYSVDSVNKYKPFNNIYDYVINEEKTPVENVAMVACHDWDLAGAKRAGLTTGYVKRKREIYNPYYPEPDMSRESLTDLVKDIIKL